MGGLREETMEKGRWRRLELEAVERANRMWGERRAGKTGIEDG